MELFNFPTDKFQVIYIDPPWPIKKLSRNVRPNQINMDYKTMSLEDIFALPISNISMENSCIFLWTIQKYLPFAFLLLEQWGFKYKHTITWDKQNGLCLFGFHLRTEFLLFGYKGKLNMYPRRKTFPTCVQEKSLRHSEKPLIFNELIEPFGEPRIELFARQTKKGWYTWGDELPCQNLI